MKIRNWVISVWRSWERDPSAVSHIYKSMDYEKLAAEHVDLAQRELLSIAREMERDLEKLYERSDKSAYAKAARVRLTVNVAQFERLANCRDAVRLL